ncbi:DUF3000 domain-containing protein [Streptomyces sp. WAC 06738]|uniref:DUF3000 domain-containing protein n=1 Tax=Streptomyces sp. WAC 06738 TaxID=2203210 RepID=UPI000F6FB43C|nr:DUF3000 domain-containing protein [Streptomyces sp. WAC 06738]AZM49368.1 DUF3000 domain-containing protein [Streptomyces sp. WAC 06738]
MVAAPGHLVDEPDGPPEGRPGGGALPPPFRRAVEALDSAAVRPEVTLRATRAPRGIAPFAYALEADVEEGAEGDAEPADGRLVLLHDPDGQDTWRGTFRFVTLLRAELEPEMAADPLLPEVCWSWLTGALDTRGLGYGEPSGTVTRASSHHFGGLAERGTTTKVEIRASWTPQPSRAAGDGAPDAAAHLAAWVEMLCQCAGLPPSAAPPAAPEPDAAPIVPLPQRRGSRRR